MKIKRFHIYLTLVAICTGYLLSYSYQFTQEQEDQGIPSSTQWYKEDQLREKLNEVKKENSLLEQHLRELQQRISETEGEMSKNQAETSTTHQELENLRLLTGLSQGKGPGVLVTLEDSSFASEALNPNDYIIHEQDVRRVVNELFAAGAEGISINGQRVTYLTSIRCVGPTIIVNGVKSSAPFQITAIGNPATLQEGLLLPGGVIDGLKSWDIYAKIEKYEELVIPAFIGEF